MTKTKQRIYIMAAGVSGAADRQLQDCNSRSRPAALALERKTIRIPAVLLLDFLNLRANTASSFLFSLFGNYH